MATNFLEKINPVEKTTTTFLENIKPTEKMAVGCSFLNYYYYYFK